MAIFVKPAFLGGRNIDADKVYFAERAIDVLEQVKAIDERERDVMVRADEIGYGNRDGIAQVDEMNMLFSEGVHRTMLEDEVAVLENIWSKFEIENGDFPVLRVEPFALGEFRPIPSEQAVNVGGEKIRASELPRLTVAGLPEGSRRLATRVCRAVDLNDDRHPAFITASDIVGELGAKNVNKYTDRDVADLKQLLREAVGDVAGAQAPSCPRLAVPRLGDERIAIGNMERICAHLVLVRELTLTRYCETDPRDRTLYNNTRSSLSFSRSGDRFEVLVPEDHKMVFASSEGQQALEAGVHILPYSAGQFVLELYDDRGRKVEDQSFTVPQIAEILDLGEHAGKIVETEGGRRLYSGLQSYVVEPGAGVAPNPKSPRYDAHIGTWSYDELTPMQDEDLAARARAVFTWPSGSLLEGVYAFEPEPRRAVAQDRAPIVVLEKYGDGNIQVTVDDEPIWLKPVTGSRGTEYRKRVYHGAGRWGDVEFEPESNEVRLVRRRAFGIGEWTHQVVLDDMPS